MLLQGQTAWLAAAAIAVLLPLMPYLPLWLNAISATAIVWRGWLLWRRVPLPPRWLVNLFALGGALGVAAQFRTLLGKDPGVALLALFLALKLFETRTVRDAFAVTLLGFFLILSQFFYTQSIVTAAMMIVATLIVTATLNALQRGATPPRAALRVAAALLIQAVPFMLILFLFFPRVSGPLWGLPADAYSGLSGLSDSMSPGSIARLSLSEAIAFRVRLPEPPPAHAQLYWRGPVLNRFDGRTWRQTRTEAAPLPEPGGHNAIDYEITLEPNNQPWLFALDHAVRLPADAFLSQNHQVIAKHPVRSRMRYSLSSELERPFGKEEPPAQLKEALQLPDGFNPRARAFAASLRAASRNDAGVVARMLDAIRREPFVYTLSPPLLGANSVDEFLFDTRKGFCEHYASAFVFVMRAAGIPARVVTGYQGGEVNPVDGFLLVRQSDAHAWAEVWSAREGWQRVDPTAAVAPTRVEVNLAAAMPDTDALPLISRPGLGWLRQARFRWEAVSNAWNQWVLGYDEKRQFDLLRTMGIPSPDWKSLGIFIAIACGSTMLMLAGWALREYRRHDPLQRLWQQFVRKLEKHGLARRPWEGPSAYGNRVAAALPGRSGEITRICTLYARGRYGKFSDVPSRKRCLSELQHRIRAFTP